MSGLEILLSIGLIISAAFAVVMSLFVYQLRGRLQEKRQKMADGESFLRLAELDPNPLIRFDIDGKVLFSNPSSKPLQQFWNIQNGAMLSSDWLKLVRKVYMQKESDIIEIEHDQKCFQLTVSPVGSQKMVHVYGVDITEKNKIIREALRKTLYDPVTDLPNRLLLLDYTKLHIDRLKKHHHLFAILVYIVDLPEIVNSNTDSIVNEMMNQIKDRLQSILSDDATLGRLSERAFLILESDFFNHGQAISFSQKILDVFSKPMDVSGAFLLPNFCIGISVFPEDTQNPELLIRNAKLAQSRAIADKKTILFYQSGMDEQVQAKRRILIDLHEALTNRELMMYYQPQMDLAKDGYIGAESLIRWKHPKRGFISPFFFIAAAEESGLIVSIGKWIIDTVSQDCKKLHQLGFPFKIAINLSGVQFIQDDLVSDIINAVERCGLAPSAIELEITEGVVIQDIDKAIEKMHQLRAAGFSLSMDDFGTGYSSLSYLKQFPIQKLKIDRSFIKDMDTSTQSYNMTRGIIELAKSLGLILVAEGAETKAQVDLLRKLKCDIIQGYYFSPAVPFDKLVEMLETQKNQSSGNQ